MEFLYIYIATWRKERLLKGVKNISRIEGDGIYFKTIKDYWLAYDSFLRIGYEISFAWYLRNICHFKHLYIGESTFVSTNEEWPIWKLKECD